MRAGSPADGPSADGVAGVGFEVSRQAVYQVAGEVQQLAGMMRAVSDQALSACSAAASACPGWHIGAASSAAGGRWHQEVTARASAVAAAGDQLHNSAAAYEMVETSLTRQISAVQDPAGQEGSGQAPEASGPPRPGQ
jgi:uncharacterized protein YukE